MPTATTADAIGSNVDSLPPNLDGYLAYEDAASGFGYIISYQLIKARFPDKPVKKVSTQPSDSPTDADLYDCEKGDYDADSAADAALGKIRANAGVPGIYCSTDLGPIGQRLSDVQAAVVARGLAVTDVKYLVADYDNVPEIPAGCVGKQYASLATYDLSVVDADWLNGSTPPPPLPKGFPDVLTSMQAADGTVYVFGLTEGKHLVGAFHNAPGQPQASWSFVDITEDATNPGITFATG